jgi:hypothetical protein
VIAAASGIAAAALSVSPARMELTRAARRTIAIVNTGTATAVVAAGPAGFVLDRRGKPAVGRRSDPAVSWLRLAPRRVVIGPGRKALVTASVRVPPGAPPGDHPALVLLTTVPPRGAGVAIRVRIGVVAVIHVDGRIVHRLEVRSLRLRRHTFETVIANRGNVIERARVRVVLLRGGRVLARVGAVARTLLPSSRAVARLRYAGTVRGWVIARVEVGAVRRRFRLRL